MSASAVQLSNTPFLINPITQNIVGLRNPDGTSTMFRRVIASGGTAIARASSNNSSDATFTSSLDIRIPAGSMGPSGTVFIDVTFGCTNSANGKTGRVTFGGSVVNNATLTNQNGARLLLAVTNRGAANSQTCAIHNGTSGGVGATSSVINTLSVATSQDVVLSLGGLWGAATSSETINIERYSIEMVYGG